MIAKILTKSKKRITFEIQCCKQCIIVTSKYGKEKGGSYINPLSANHAKWLNTLKEFVGELLHWSKFKFDALVDALYKKKKLTARSADQCKSQDEEFIASM